MMKKYCRICEMPDKEACPAQGHRQGLMLPSVHHLLTQHGEGLGPGATLSWAVARGIQGLKRRPTGGTSTPYVLETGPGGSVWLRPGLPDREGWDAG